MKRGRRTGTPFINGAELEGSAFSQNSAEYAVAELEIRTYQVRTACFCRGTFWPDDRQAIPVISQFGSIAICEKRDRNVPTAAE